MARKSVPASVRETAFDCPHCGAFTTQTWFHSYVDERSKGGKTPHIINKDWKKQLTGDFATTEMDMPLREWLEKMSTGNVFFDGKPDSHYTYGVHNLSLSQCYNCAKIAIWVYDRLLYPAERQGALPSPDLPEDVLHDYEEARSIVNLSPRGAAALLRLCVQKLCVALGKKGKSVDDDIASLVADGLNPLVQKSLDIVRVIGNESVHPGVMDLKDDRDTAVTLFGLVNLIADQMITHPKTINAMYDSLPAGKKAAIATRDKKTTDGPK